MIRKLLKRVDAHFLTLIMCFVLTALISSVILLLIKLGDMPQKARAEIYYASALGYRQTDSCNRVRITANESPSCPRLTWNDPGACRDTTGGAINNVSNFSMTFTVSSNDGGAHTINYETATNFCDNKHLNFGFGGYCSCTNNAIHTPASTSIPAGGSRTITVNRANPYGQACGSYQFDLWIDSVDGNNGCNFGNVGITGISGVCETGRTCIPPPPTYSVTGNVFNDANKNRVKDGTEANYTGGISITSVNNSTGANAGTITTNNGAYTVTGLNPGTYRISYPTLPANYSLTYPQTGPPPSYQVTVGAGCTTNGALGASCTANNITDLNFAITNSIPWIQSYDLDIRFDDGYTDTIPQSPSYPPYAIAQSGNAANPGIVFSGDSSFSFGQGQASSANWQVGGTTYSEVFQPNTSQLQTSYQHLLDTATGADITPTNLNTVPSCSNFANCTLPASLPNGIYQANGNVTINNYNVGANKDQIFLINGNLTLNGNITIPTTSTTLFASSRDIIVPSNVGAVTNTFPLPTAQLQGFYSAGEDFIVQGINNCLVGTDRMLVVAGAVIVNANGAGGDFINQRDLCGGNPQYPAFSIQARPDFILNAPSFLMKQNTVFREDAP